MTFIKICGITNAEDALAAVEAGADAIGFNFWRPGKRYVRPEEAGQIAALLPENVWKVGIFVDEDLGELHRIARLAQLNAVQMHGTEAPSYVAAVNGYRKLKALHVGVSFSPRVFSLYNADAFVLDAVGATPGGTGKTFDWEVAAQAGRFADIVMAGGLTPENVAEAVRIVRPWGVDVATGVESAPGKKDAERVREFIAAVRKAEQP